jgi:hypothetical protein
MEHESGLKNRKQHDVEKPMPCVHLQTTRQERVFGLSKPPPRGSIPPFSLALSLAGAACRLIRSNLRILFFLAVPQRLIAIDPRISESSNVGVPHVSWKYCCDIPFYVAKQVSGFETWKQG